MPPPFLWISGIVVALLAAGVHHHRHRRQGRTSKRAAAAEVYVIGDLHGDVGCAEYWVERLGLVTISSSSSSSSHQDKIKKREQQQQQQWLKPNASLVFMGDYCDKGPYSYQTMQFVKSLTDAFPDRVTALMGNHEMELLRDRHNETAVKYMQLAYSSLHPQEYLNFLERDVEETDYYVVDLLLNASLEVYARRWYQSILLAPKVDKQQDSRRYAITELFDETLRPLVQERLAEYQNAYLKAFASNTTLGQWVESLKVAHVENGVLFTHGGISRGTAEQINKVGGVDELNKLVRKYSNDQAFGPFLKNSPEGKAVYEMLVYRGNHKTGACEELDQILNELNVERLAVGHTPGENVRSLCSDKFLALDSLLGRWIRTSGNFYCDTKKRISQDGNFVCNDLVQTCEGQVVKITKTGIEVIS